MILRLIVLTIFIGYVVKAAPDWRVVSGEYKSLRRMGDQVEAEYERLHPDGSITRKVASGDITKGLTYDNFRIDPKGNVRRLAPGDYAPVDPFQLDPVDPFHLGFEEPARRPETPRLGKVESRPKPVKNPLKDFFQDVFSW